MSSFLASSTSLQKRTRIYGVADFKAYNIRPGSRLQIERPGYSHWAIYLGDGKVCHLTARDDGGPKSGASLNVLHTTEAIVLVESFTDMMQADDSPVYVNNANDTRWTPLPPEEIVRRAESKKGQSEYGLLHYNCESFANWCRYDTVESDQVEVGKWVLILGSVALGVFAPKSM